jgi:hypothetical protein
LCIVIKNTEHTATASPTKLPSTQASDSVNPEDIDSNELQQFKIRVNKWCELDNKIKQFEQVVKAHKKLKEDLCEDILQFMEGYDISDLKTPFGKLQKVESFTKTPITKGLIGQRVESYFSKLGVKNSKEQSETLVKDLYDNRDKKKSVRLRRIIPKEPKAPKEPNVTKETKISKKVKTIKEEGSSISRKSNVPESLKKI